MRRRRDTWPKRRRNETAPSSGRRRVGAAKRVAEAAARRCRRGLGSGRRAVTERPRAVDENVAPGPCRGRLGAGGEAARRASWRPSSWAPRAWASSAGARGGCSACRKRRRSVAASARERRSAEGQERIEEWRGARSGAGGRRKEGSRGEFWVCARGEGGRRGVGFKQAGRRLGRETRGFGRVRSEVLDRIGWMGHLS